MSLFVIILIVLLIAVVGRPMNVGCPPPQVGHAQCSTRVHGYLFRQQTAWPGILSWQTSWGGTYGATIFNRCLPTGNLPGGFPAVPGGAFIRYRAKCNLWSQSPLPIGPGAPFCNIYSLADVEKPAAQIGFFHRATQEVPGQGTSILRPAVILMQGSTPEISCDWYDGHDSCTAKVSTYFKQAKARFIRTAPVCENGVLIRPGLLRVVFGSKQDHFCCANTTPFGTLGCYPLTYEFPEPWTGSLGPEDLELKDVNVSIDLPHANEYQYAMLGPVEPIEQNPLYDPEEPANVPYYQEPNAPNEGITNDTFMRPQICYTRTGANAGVNNRFKNDGITTMRIPEGVRGITAYSHGDARMTFLKNYCDGCQTFGLPCEYPDCSDIVENLWRHFIGKSAVTVKRWEDDPEGRGWYVQYENTVHMWFVQDGAFTQQWYWGPPPGPRFRWNAWYKGYISCKVHGSLEDAAFVDWVKNQDSGFGVDYHPRSLDCCNDVLAMCAGQLNALPGEIYPAEFAQQTCDYNSGDPATLPPCLRNNRPASRWFFPLVGQIPPGNDPCLVPSNGFPECGLYHRVERRKKLDPAHATEEVQYGWAKLIFATDIPQVVVDGGG